MATTELERPLSALSISSSSKSTDLDWDHQSSNASVSVPVTPSPRRRHLELPDVEGTPLARLRASHRPLADLLRLHRDEKDEGVHGFESLHLTEEEEGRLREALDNWVSSSQSNTQCRTLIALQVNGEDDDCSFHTLNDSDDGSSPRESRTRSTTLNGDDASLRERHTLDHAPKETENA